MNIIKQSTTLTDRIIREGECHHLTGICRTTRYMMEKEGRFPQRRKIGGRSVGWMLSEILEWQRLQPKVISEKAG
ncbi:helix-turn-helix transcriptional regulator [Dickeya chrysanthemi]|uniref:helix-turn-helix transcriptional regulator n=1 Tax=Dickeya chrysanthemi TaxID=556 RepID=UPI0008FBFC26|nr:AlpA family phage regulatory protein [Dickeya chrysanthemi]